MHAIMAWWRAPGGARTRLVASLVAVTLSGVLLGLLVGGHVSGDVGPFRAQFAVTPSLTGGSEVKLPPLGAIRFRSHDGPAHLTVDLNSLDSSRTIDLVSRPGGVERASSTAAEDIERGVQRLALQATAAAVLATMLLAALLFRSMRRVALCGGLALALALGSLAASALTFRRQSISEPTYDGLLVNARSVVGDAGKIVEEYDAYRAQLQQLITNVGQIYSTITTLPVYQPPDGTITVLHISDLHLNPSAWSVIRTVVRQFHVTVIADTGDITDWGSEPEASFVNQIGTLGVPYVYVRGNHDSSQTEAAVRRQPNAVVLDNKVAVVAGLRIAGVGDPRFTPDKSAPPDPRLQAGISFVGHELAQTITGGPPVDIALVHDPASAGPLAGEVPLVLAGHLHHREVSDLPVVGSSRFTRTQLFVEGSTGGAGLRGLEVGEPLPLQLSVLYFGQDHVLKAYDAISVGGTGLAQVSLERHIVTPARAASSSANPAVSPTSGR
jgi:predicted MPP superfamily phosphohydrolase